MKGVLFIGGVSFKTDTTAIKQDVFFVIITPWFH